MAKSIGLSQMGHSNTDDFLVGEIPVTQTLPQRGAKEVTYKVYRLVATNRKGKVHIDGMGDFINPATGKLERARLLRGVDTIWMKEQKDIPESYATRNRRSLIFDGSQKKKIFRVASDDAAMLEFISVCNHLIDNPNRRTGSKHEFYEWNPQKQQEAALKKRMRRLDAIKAALEVPEEKMRKHALYLGVVMADELGMPKTTDGIRDEYLLKVEEDPEKFFDSLDAKVVEISYMVKKAISSAKIDLGRQPNAAYWSNGGGFIGLIPRDRKPAEYLIELANTNSEEGRSFLEILTANTK